MREWALDSEMQTTSSLLKFPLSSWVRVVIVIIAMLLAII